MASEKDVPDAQQQTSAATTPGADAAAPGTGQGAGAAAEASADAGSVAADIAPSRPAATPTAGGSSRALAVIALLVSVTALGGFGFLWYHLDMGARLRSASLQGDITLVQQRLQDLREHSDRLVQQTQSQLGQLNTQLQGQVDQLGTQVQGQLEQFRSEQTARSDAITGLRTEFSALRESVGKLYEELDRSLDTWVVEEVEQLLLLANHRLQLSRDVSMAARALQMADRRLEEIGDPAYVEVRQRIANEQAALAAVPRVDVAGFAVRIAALGSRVEQWPLKARASFRGAAEAPAASPEKLQHQLLEAGREMWQDVSKLVRIQQTDETRQPLLPPEQSYFLQQNVRLRLDAAQLALLQGDAGIYTESLNTALAWLRGYFDGEDEDVAAAARELEALAAEDVRPALPDISGSLAALRRQVKSKARTES